MQSNIQKKIEHVVVLMMENRSFDNLLGWLYEKDQPQHFLPINTPNSEKKFNGLSGKDYSNPVNLDNLKIQIPASKGKGNFRVPNPDPNEEFKYMNRQIYGNAINKNDCYWLPVDPCKKPAMDGFLYDYSKAKCSNTKIAKQIMQSYTPENLTVLSQVAQQYAVSDNYHASAPTQTWPNRAFMHTGTSEGNVNNKPYIPYNSETIFNVLKNHDVTWKVYKSSKIIPSLTRIQLTKLWHFDLDECFQHVDDFINACHNEKICNLPAYSFIEPSFVVENGANATSEHPPANVCAGDHFLEKIVNAVVSSKHFDKILLVINFDEHGGCPDHVAPSCNAISPDEKSMKNKSGFTFQRYGVRVPALFISPHIKANTCIRANSNPWEWTCDSERRPFDHTSLLAMLLDWKNIDRNCLPSKRVIQAPNNLFDDLLDGDVDNKGTLFHALCTYKKESLWSRIKNFIKGLFGYCADGKSLTSLQKSIIAADLHYRTARRAQFKEGTLASADSVEQLLKEVRTEAQMVKYFQSHS